MNTKKFQVEGCSDCSILSRYEAIQNDQLKTPGNSELQAAKLEILERLIKENKCPAGHNLKNRVE